MTPARNTRKYANRFLATAGSLAGLTVAESADAKVIYVTDRPVTVELHLDQHWKSRVLTSVTWDIDGDGVSEFLLNPRTAMGGQYSDGGRSEWTSFDGQRHWYRTWRGFYLHRWDYVGLTISSDLDRPAGRPRAALRLNGSMGAKALGSSSIGPSDYFRQQYVTVWSFRTFYWHSESYAYRSGVLTHSKHITFSGTNGPYRWNSTFDRFTPGENLVGFRFYDDAGIHFGFAVFQMDFNTGNVTILRWAYESEVGKPIHVLDAFPSAGVPEPSSLALLATGAAGLLAYRARRKAKPNAPADEDRVAQRDEVSSSASCAFADENLAM